MVQSSSEVLSAPVSALIFWPRIACFEKLWLACWPVGEACRLPASALIPSRWWRGFSPPAAPSGPRIPWPLSKARLCLLTCQSGIREWTSSCSEWAKR